MGWRIEVSGDTLARLVYALQLAALVAVVAFVVSPFGSSANLPLAVLFGVLVVTTAVGAWRARTDGDGGTRVGTAEDITHDPFADPGQAARDRWEKAVRRLPGDDED